MSKEKDSVVERDVLEGVHVMGQPIKANHVVPIIWGDYIFAELDKNFEMAKRGICDWEGMCEYGGMVKFYDKTPPEIGDGEAVTFTPVANESDYVFIGNKEHFTYEDIDALAVQKDPKEFGRVTTEISKDIMAFFEKLEKSVGTFSKLAWSLSSVSFISNDECKNRIQVSVDYGYQVEEE